MQTVVFSIHQSLLNRQENSMRKHLYNLYLCICESVTQIFSIRSVLTIGKSLCGMFFRIIVATPPPLVEFIATPLVIQCISVVCTPINCKSLACHCLLNDNAVRRPVKGTTMDLILISNVDAYATL